MSDKFIILYCTGSLSAKGGIERVLSNKSKIFAEECDIEIHIATLDNKRPAYRFSDKICFHSVKPQRKFKRRIPFLTNYLIKRALYQEYDKLISSINPNLVIVLEKGTDDFFLPNICHKHNIPIVREFHFAKSAVREYSKLLSFKDKWEYRLRYIRTFRAFNNYDWVVLLTQKDQVESHYKCKTIVIPNIVPIENEENCSDYSRKVVVSVGSISNHRKGFKDLIQIWEHISHKHPEWKLRIYGGGSLLEEYRDYIRLKGLSDNIEFCGITSNIEEKLINSSIFSFCSVAEGLPMVIIEAMGKGLPCVSYDTPTGPSDIISNGIDGFVVPVGDKLAFEQELLKLIEDGSLLRNMGQKAKEKAQLYSAKSIIPMWLDFFSQFGYKVPDRKP